MEEQNVCFKIKVEKKKKKVETYLPVNWNKNDILKWTPFAAGPTFLGKGLLWEELRYCGPETAYEQSGGMVEVVSKFKVSHWVGRVHCKH